MNERIVGRRVAPRESKSVTRSLSLGALHGVAATAAMSAWMAAWERAGLLGKSPPRKITERLVVGLSGSWPGRSKRLALSSLNHLAFGAAAGALFQFSARRLSNRTERVVAGMAYGVTIWASMYGWVLPALHLMPRVARDRKGRPTAMASAHLVFGAALGALS